LKRGDIVTVAISGDNGKPRPALVIQSDFIDQTDSVLVCLITTGLHNAPIYRITVAASEATGLRNESFVMADKIMAVRRDRCGIVIGRADDEFMTSLGRNLAIMIGVAD
jgi:mRNA interferase MazF